MIHFTTTILKFEKMGEKTGWSYIEIHADLAQKLKPGNKKSFTVKGKLDNYSFSKTSLLPMGEGKFIMPLKASLRKSIGKEHGAIVKVEMEEDKSKFVFNKDFMACLQDEPLALNYFRQLPGSHQKYFSKWIDGAKTDTTKANRIAQAVNSLSKEKGFAEMMRSLKNYKIS
ncbi:MAG TPA: YdeI/OmpD-associated family protein [Bacteroidia bacterium]